jgi:two-component system chemotaxis response regulator CheY
VIADDSATPRDILRRVLRNAGYDVVEACTNGDDAVKACRTYKPDVAVLDVSMPGGIAGTEAARIIVEEKLATHVVIASSLGFSVVTDQFEKLGVKFVSKPYNAEIFLKTLNAVLLDGSAVSGTDS